LRSEKSFARPNPQNDLRDHLDRGQKRPRSIAAPAIAEKVFFSLAAILPAPMRERRLLRVF
jgi:hypothetical protein